MSASATPTTPVAGSHIARQDQRGFSGRGHTVSVLGHTDSAAAATRLCWGWHSRRQYVSREMWLCPHKILFTKAGGSSDLTCGPFKCISLAEPQYLEPLLPERMRNVVFRLPAPETWTRSKGAGSRVAGMQQGSLSNPDIFD